MKMLSIATLIVVVLAAFALMKREGSGATPPEAGRPFLPELAAHVNDVAAITVTGADGAFTVRRADDRWTLDPWGGHPADFAVVKGTVTGLADLVVRAAMTSKKEKHAQLGLEEPGAGSGSTGVRLVDADGAVLADVVIGESRPGTPPTLFVRNAGDDRTWQVDGQVDVPATLARWADKELLRVAADRVARVTLVHADGETLTVEREPVEPPPPVEGDDDAPPPPVATTPEWTLADMPVGRELRSSYVLSSLAGGIARLDLDGVVDEADVPADQAWDEARYETTDGVTYTLRLAEHEGAHWVRIDVARAADATADAQAVDALAARLAQRTFELASWRAGTFDKRLDDLLAPLPADEAGDAGETPAGAPFAPSDVEGADAPGPWTPEGLGEILPPDPGADEAEEAEEAGAGPSGDGGEAVDDASGSPSEEPAAAGAR